VIKSMVGLDTLIYAGNHGLEIEGPGIPYRAMAGAQCRATVARIAGALGVALASVPGVLVENKGLTLSLHYRRVGRAALPRVFAAFDRITRPYVHEKLIGIHPGKQVLEARPAVRWDKGDAVRWLLKK
jgi:trehalose-phosphatase